MIFSANTWLERPEERRTLSFWGDLLALLLEFMAIVCVDLVSYLRIRNKNGWHGFAAGVQI
jgi:hypothetical protein